MENLKDEVANAASVVSVDMKLEVVVIPVSDVDRAKAFYAKLGWRLDIDVVVGDDFRAMQFTPPGSGCSIILGKNVTAAAPGSAQGLYLIVSDIEAARNELLRRGVAISEVFHDNGVHVGPDEPYMFGTVRVTGPDSNAGSYRSFASFSDPDGNGWLLQEVTTRLAGRIDATTTFASVNDLRTALWRAALAHGEHEKRTGGQRDENWPEWYAAYMVAEQAGTELPT
jgi:catechol 2,3-dioxygenase-like lactoylglutathione lyase family enzyme